MAHISIYCAGRICPLMQAHFLCPRQVLISHRRVFGNRGSIYLFLSDDRKMTPSPETVSDL